jgi:hypothetical protein
MAEVCIAVMSMAVMTEMGMAFVDMAGKAVMGMVVMGTAVVGLKVPKCENFHRTDFFYFFTIKPLWVGDFRAKMKISKF